MNLVGGVGLGAEKYPGTRHGLEALHGPGMAFQPFRFVLAHSENRDTPRLSVLGEQDLEALVRRLL